MKINLSKKASRKLCERQALERTFIRFQFKIGKRTWTRSDLHERP
jgi:hypothetical protein